MHFARNTPPASSARPKPSHQDARYVYRTHKIALDPTAEQRTVLEQHADHARCAYNWALRRYNDGKKAGDEPTIDTLKRKWKELNALKYPWGKALSQKGAEYAIEALGFGIRTGRERRLANAAPRFRSRTRKTAFRIVNTGNRVRCKGRSIDLSLPAIGAIRARQELRYKDGRIVRVTVKREAGRWYACVTVKRPKPPMRRMAASPASTSASGTWP